MAGKPDLIIGLICAAGTDLSDVKQQLKAQLAVVGYNYVEIKVSGAIADALSIPKIDDEYQRMRRLMDGGDSIRRNSSDGSGVASLIVTALRLERGTENEHDNSTAYVIDSLKNPKEVEVLDLCMGGTFIAYQFTRTRIVENRSLPIRFADLERSI